MKLKAFIGFMVSVLCFTVGLGNALADQTPTEFLKEKDGQLSKLLEGKKKNNTAILKIIGEMMDFDALAEASLGNNWSKRSADEQKDFRDTLKSLIEDNLIKRLTDSKEHKITYEGEKVNKENTEGSVTTIVKIPKGVRHEEIEIEYIVKKKGNTWIVVDTKTDGVSLVSNYQAEFNKTIAKDGFDALMKKMKDKLPTKQTDKKPELSKKQP